MRAVVILNYNLLLSVVLCSQKGKLEPSTEMALKVP